MFFLIKHVVLSASTLGIPKSNIGRINKQKYGFLCKEKERKKMFKSGVAISLNNWNAEAKK